MARAAANSAQIAAVSAQFARELAAMRQGATAAWEREARALGSLLVNVLIRYTAPNRPSDGDAALKANSPGLARLRGRIAEDMTGNRAGTPPRAVPIYHARDGRWMARRVQGTTGHFGLVVPEGRIRKGQKLAVIESPGELLAWLQANTDIRRNSKGRYNRWLAKGIPYGAEPTFARIGAIRGAVRTLQRRAGYMLSGWAHASAALRQGSPSPGTHANLGGPGGIDINQGQTSGEVEYIMYNDVTYGKSMDRVAGALAERETVYQHAQHAMEQRARNIAAHQLAKSLNRPINIR